EEVGPHLNLLVFLHEKLFVETGVNIVNAVGSKIGEIAGSIAGSLVAGISVAIAIQERLLCDGSAIRTDAGAAVAKNIGPLVAIGEPGICHENRKWLATLFSKEGRDSPPAHESVEETIHVAADPALLSDREIDDYCSCDALRSVIGADSVLGF